jgi:hypothetical protein
MDSSDTIFFHRKIRFGLGQEEDGHPHSGGVKTNQGQETVQYGVVDRDQTGDYRSDVCETTARATR